MTSPSQQPVEVVLLRSANRWREISGLILRAADGLRNSVGAEACAALVPQLDGHVDALRRAVAHFEESARHPEVVIATTGTTSSGKSTLANLLVGDTLLPKAVQEMSAGVVTIHHDPEVRRLVVEDTRGAQWSTGTWEASTAAEVQAHLESAMLIYRDMLRDGDGSGAAVEPPRFRVTWPTRMGSRPGDFGLPAGMRLTLVDLPGLKYIDDELNGSVVREQARRALCLVAYNAFETDSRKQEALLRQVVDQVKTLSGSPARMLFVLNRIDAYRTEHDPDARERAFTDRVTRQIRASLGEALSEYAAEASRIEPIPLSSEPALYAVLAERAGPGNDVPLLRRLAKEYATLFPDQEMDRLPRSPVDWDEGQRRWFLAEARHQSRVDTFERRLGVHITTHLPELLLPELVDAAYRPARGALEALDALVRSYSLNERAQVEEARARLEALYQRLRALQKEEVALLDPLREAARSDGDLLLKLAEAIPKVEAALGLAEARGQAGRLGSLLSALTTTVQEPLNRLFEHVFLLMKGEDAEDVLIQSAAPKLPDAVHALRKSPFGGVWSKGGSFEGGNAERVNLALSAFARSLSSAATSLIDREAGLQSGRSKEALDACAEAVVQRIERAALVELDRAGFPGLRGVFRGTFELDPPRLPRVRFAADVKQWSRMEERVEREEYWVQKRVWWKLWLGRSRVKETRSVIRTTTREGIEVAKLGDLLEGFTSSGMLKELEESFAEWLGQSILYFDKALGRRLDDGIKTYRRALEQRLAEIERNAESRIERVERFRGDVAEALKAAEAGRDWRGVVDG